MTAQEHDELLAEERKLVRRLHEVNDAINELEDARDKIANRLAEIDEVTF
jgi:hypothetical protein